MGNIYKCVDGVYTLLTDEEIADMEISTTAPIPTLEERVTAVEESTEALKIIMGVEE